MPSYSAPLSTPPPPTHPQVQQQHSAPGASDWPLLRCGPLLRYCGIDYPDENGESGAPMWRGSVLLVVSTAGAEKVRHRVPEVLFTGEVATGGQYGGGVGGSRMRGEFDEGIGLATGGEGEGEVEGENVCCYRYDICVALEEVERRVTYIVCGVERVVHDNEEKEKEEEEKEKGKEEQGKSNQDTSSEKSTPLPTTTTTPLRTSFHLPTSHSTMRLIFHTCNGFSLNVPLTTFTGPVLFRSLLPLLTSPTTAPHLLLGGGDQIYSDAVRTTGPLSHWANLDNPSKRRKYPYSPDLARQVNSWYRENYISWYMTRPFSDVNGRIPMVNMWDDHDIIDGWGSYTDHFMQCPVFLGVGRAAWRYYMVFQHHTPPEGAPEGDEEDESWVLSPNKGRYIPQQGRSIYARLGRSIALLALDARTERTRRAICPPETYDAVFGRLERELTRAAGSSCNGVQQPIKHILILLGVPIAYPRLAWLEIILRSPLIGLVKFLNKRFGVGGKLFNRYDGEVDILDDLDDHWAARIHKKERAALINRWQALSRKYSVRVSILSGDVHLAAVGRFFTRVPKGLRHGGGEEEMRRLCRDWRYTPNIISSAVTNMPPPRPVAVMLARRNKVHRFGDCEETMWEVFRENGDGGERWGWERVLMPRRNYCVIKMVGEEGGWGEQGDRREEEVGGLWVELRVERKTGDWRGGTKGYGFVVPKLVMQKDVEEQADAP
ncbi:hypothetical protein EV426DRAFT_633950 [Tirmania nivea]|nr:hypothetical protein EV426DRAFT_633950 [Tirmania nivea]